MAIKSIAVNGKTMQVGGIHDGEQITEITEYGNDPRNNPTILTYFLKGTDGKDFAEIRTQNAIVRYKKEGA